MNLRSVAILAVVTLAAVIGAVVVVSLEAAPITVAGDREPAFPKLVANINNVGAIEIESPEHRFTVTGEGSAWGIVEKNNYRVPRETVRNFLLAIANLRLVEGKTAMPERYEYLDVEDPKTSDPEDFSDARAIRILAKDGEELAAGVIGRRKYFLYVDGRGGTYLRREGEERAWLAEGEVNFGGSPPEWLDRTVLKLDPEQVERYTIRHPDGEVLTGRRETPGEKVHLDDMPEDREFKTETEADRLALVIEEFQFADVFPAPHQNFETFEGERHTAEYQFFDGLVVEFEVITLPKPEGASEYDEPPRWARVTARVAEDAPQDTRAEAEKKAAEINAMTAGWEYRLEELDGLRTTKRLEDMLEPATS